MIGDGEKRNDPDSHTSDVEPNKTKDKISGLDRRRGFDHRSRVDPRAPTDLRLRS